MSTYREEVEALGWESVEQYEDAKRVNAIVAIDGMLSAYRNGWIAYDREDVMRLRAKRAELTKEGG